MALPIPKLCVNEGWRNTICALKAADSADRYQLNMNITKKILLTIMFLTGFL